MIYGYIRISSDKQTVENQRFEIKNFCKRQNIKIYSWIEDVAISENNTVASSTPTSMHLA